MPWTCKDHWETPRASIFASRRIARRSPGLPGACPSLGTVSNSSACTALRGLWAGCKSHRCIACVEDKQVKGEELAKDRAPSGLRALVLFAFGYAGLAACPQSTQAQRGGWCAQDSRDVWRMQGAKAKRYALKPTASPVGTLYVVLFIRLECCSPLR